MGNCGFLLTKREGGRVIKEVVEIVMKVCTLSILSQVVTSIVVLTKVTIHKLSKVRILTFCVYILLTMCQYVETSETLKIIQNFEIDKIPESLHSREKIICSKSYELMFSC